MATRLRNQSYKVMDALRIETAIVAGFDWGARTANIVAATTVACGFESKHARKDATAGSRAGCWAASGRRRRRSGQLQSGP